MRPWSMRIPDVAAGFVHVVVFLIVVGSPLFASAASIGWQTTNGFRLRQLEIAAFQRTNGFSEVSSALSGITFTNTLADEAIAPNYNLMLGSGVAAGDYDGDGLCDLYFCAIQGTNALFRNLGNWRFENRTTQAGVGLPWRTNTGATFADVDGDGKLDLIVTSLGRGVSLLINRGDGTFRDATPESGLGGSTGSLSLAIGDTDGDGDLDIYVCNYGAQALSRGRGEFFVKTANGQTVIRGAGAERLRVDGGKLIELGEPDTLFVNQGGGKFRATPWNSPAFLDENGKPLAAPWDFGLSAQMRDINGDGAPEIYVCNDFDTPDRFWMNDGKGNFRLQPRLAQRVQSYASMGVDFTDVDRDGNLDFFVVEMLSPSHGLRLRQRIPRLPTNARPGFFEDRPEIGRNTLFRGRGDGTFAELANFAGVAASDWSWQGSFLDVDLDGFDDLLVVNGHPYDTQDMDTPRSAEGPNAALQQLRAMTPLNTPNRAWRNAGGFRFEEAEAWSFNHTNVSHGLAFADLDNDGDLDAVLNCLNSPPLLLRNNAGQPRLAVRLRGAAPNTAGIGARITLRGGAVPVQSHEMICGGKYLSSDEALRVFAAGKSTSEMTFEVVWRNGRTSVVRGVKANHVYEIDETAAKSMPPATPAAPQPLFVEAADDVRHSHHELVCDDFQLQPLLDRKLSQRGPGICVTDLDGDGHEDLLFGAGRGGQMTFHRGDGRGRFKFAGSSPKLEDDLLALVEWWPVAGIRGVLATMADNETVATAPPLRLITLVEGELRFDSVAVEGFTETASVGYCMAVGDYDGDSDLDVFVGAHAMPGQYPRSARSRLLRNSNGVLQIDLENTEALAAVNLANAALWTDLNGDGWPDLALACEWDAVRVFQNERGKLKEITDSLGLKAHSGWWNGITSGDFDGDGRLDLLVGNWGLNGPERASREFPLQLFYGDFLGRNVVDLIHAEYDSSHGLEAVPRDQLSHVALGLPMLPERYRTHREWASTTVREALAPFRNVQAVSVTTLATTLFLNRGTHFEPRPLPAEAQWTPANGVAVADFDGDGNLDSFLSQNFFAVRSEQARLDSGRGLLLRGDGRGGFVPVNGAESGILVYGEQRAASVGDFDEDGRPDLIVSQNGAVSRLYRNARGQSGFRVKAEGKLANPRAVGAALWLEESGKSGPVVEIHGGSGWLSHDSPVVTLGRRSGGDDACRLHVRWPGGRETITEVAPGSREVTVRAPSSREPR